MSQAVSAIGVLGDELQRLVAVNWCRLRKIEDSGHYLNEGKTAMVKGSWNLISGGVPVTKNL